MSLSRQQNAEQNHILVTGNIFFEIVAGFKYLGTAEASQNFIPEKIKNRLNSGSAWNDSAQNLLSSRFVSMNLIKIHIALYRCKIGLSL